MSGDTGGAGSTTVEDPQAHEPGGEWGTSMTTMAQRTEHLSNRPHWTCRACRKPWPCANAKADLLEEFNVFPSVLTIYLSAQMYDAMVDMTAHGEPAPSDLYDRFLSWTCPE